MRRCACGARAGHDTHTAGSLLERLFAAMGGLDWSIPWCALLGGLLRAPGAYMVYSLGGVRPLPPGYDVTLILRDETLSTRDGLSQFEMGGPPFHST